MYSLLILRGLEQHKGSIMQMSSHITNKKYIAIVFVISCLWLTAISKSSTFAYYQGNSNYYLYDSKSGCHSSQMTVAEDVSSAISELDGKSQTNTYSWQVEVPTAQQTPAYQWIAAVKGGIVSSSSGYLELENLLGGGKLDGIEASPTNAYYMTQTTTTANVYGTFNSSSYLTAANWYLHFDNGQGEVYTDIVTILVPNTLQAQPNAYQSVLVGYNSNDPTANFSQGRGYFTYSVPGKLSVYNWPPCAAPSWSTVESSNMYYVGLNCAGGTCNQEYGAPAQLTMTPVTGLSITPSSGLQPFTQSVQISATGECLNHDELYSFKSWSGSGPGSYSGTNNPAQITMNGAITETASANRVSIEC